jgi:hypothetical protein
VNQTYTLDTGIYLLLALDGTEVMTRQNITALSQLDLYLTWHRATEGSIVLFAQPSLTRRCRDGIKPAGCRPDCLPKRAFLLHSAQTWCVTQYDGHEALLLDFENITQDYINSWIFTAYASNPRITNDGTAYTLMTYCTNCYPTTHGYLLLGRTARRKER